ncbi:hypothetical protein E1301_Tti000855 [Triplophysa tibetana]|uniref:Uncharacterized protein n=1 Tax=Triplophysa tibetana TaxID=1572043 RepID=A0A5A9N547_9TELE|nr:hypothetical protein E1301_Tti000855 [Triplophysa tibetana]
MRATAAGGSENDRLTPDGTHKSTAAAASLFKPAPLHRTPQRDWLKCLIEIYICLHKLWRIISTSQQDDVLIKHNSSVPLTYPEFHVYRSHNLTRFAHRKEFSLGNPKPLVFGADYLTSFPSVLLPATTPYVSERLGLSQNYKNSLTSLRAHNFFSVQSYPDPLLGATSSFFQRLTEISSLEAETVRQEKIRKLKKINRQDS